MCEIVFCVVNFAVHVCVWYRLLIGRWISMDVKNAAKLHTLILGMCHGSFLYLRLAG